jgi:uncharacterized protein YecT (DUF1311 family)
MQQRSLRTTLAIAAILTAACADGVKEESPGEVLARDSALASDLKQSDTSAFAEAADVAMAFDPDSAMPPIQTSTTPVSAPAAASRPIGSAAASAPSPVPMRVDGSASARPTPAPAPQPARDPTPAGARMRPIPATIHADPIPPRLPARPPTPNSSALAILEKVPGAALPPAGSEATCASPASADQRRCLMLHLSRSDIALDRTYQALIADLKREAGTPRGAKEPESVEQLRSAQRAWLVYRDTECRRRNRGREGPLWAPVRAQCLGEFSGQRTEELAQALRERRRDSER